MTLQLWKLLFLINVLVVGVFTSDLLKKKVFIRVASRKIRFVITSIS